MIGDDLVTMNDGGVIFVRRPNGTRLWFQPMNCNASPDIVNAIREAIDDAYKRGRADIDLVREQLAATVEALTELENETWHKTTTADRPHP